MKKEKKIAKKMVINKIHHKMPHLHISEDPQDMAVVLAVVVMTLYYIWRMFYITPSYEELSNYFYFISKGAVFTVTNWSPEGNHIGYNLFSSILNCAGIPKYIAMRGISCMASSLNLILLYMLSKRYFAKWIPFATIITYSGFELVNLLNVQGRGYTLSVTLFLLSIYILGKLTNIESFSTIQYIFLTVTFTAALYIHLWNFNFVIPMCIAVLLYLLINGIRTRKVSGKGKNIYFAQLFKILVCEIIAFLLAAILYTINILGSGASNLASSKGFENLSRIQIISKDPVRAFLKGLELLKESFGMIEPEGTDYITRWYHFIYDFSKSFTPNFPYVLMVICFVSIFVMLAGCILSFEESRTCIRLIILCQMFWMPFILIFVKKVPSYESYMFMGVIMAMDVSFVVNNLVSMIEKFNIQVISYGAPIVLAEVFFFIGVFGGKFIAPYDEEIDEAYEALIMVNPTGYKEPVVTDSIQEYLMEFLYDTHSSKDIENADYLLMKKILYEDKMIERSTKNEHYQVVNYYDADSIPWDYINKMHRSYENGNYILFTK